MTSKTASDGMGNSYLTSYSYGEAAMNALGNLNGGQGPNAYPNSAALVMWDKAGRPSDTLAEAEPEAQSAAEPPRRRRRA